MLTNLKQVKTSMKDDLQQQLMNARIMMVDDELTTMEVVQAFLEDKGYHNFVLVDKSVEAMKVLEERRPDILLLDLMMPEVSGFDILSAVRNHPKFKYLPIVILTSSSDADNKLQAFDLGATDFLAKPVDPCELDLRVRNTLAAKAYIDQLAYYDSLTKLPNRQLFLERFDWALTEAKRHKHNVALLHMELDNFDRINDTIGLNAGDEVLCLIARRIEGIIRRSDVLGFSMEEGDDLINLFRLDGNVYSLLLDQIKSADHTAIVAERIIEAIREPIQLENRDVYVTASIGIAVYPPDSEDCMALLRLASSAKDYVKSNGGNSFQFSSDSINAMYEQRLDLDSRLRKALERDQFLLHYQPKVNIVTGTIEGVEALIRWKDDNNNIVSPYEFIPLAEETGLIVPISKWVMKEAFTKLRQWHESGIPPITMSVNLSVRHFQEPDLIATVRGIIQSSGVDPQYLTIEITEGLLMDDIDSKIKILEQMKALDLNISIDDFGTGYSSLGYLSRLPVDEIKIDRSFIIDVVESSSSRAIALSVIFLAHSLGLETVAEGVETEQQLGFLKKERCSQYQGFLFSRPIPEDALLKLLSSKD